MSVEDADTADDGPTDDRFERELIALLRGLSGDVEPWKVRPPETSTGRESSVITAGRVAVGAPLPQVIVDDREEWVAFLCTAALVLDTVSE